MPQYTEIRKLPYIDVDNDTFRSTAIMVENAMTILDTHTHPDLINKIDCLKKLVDLVGVDSKRIAARPVGDMFTVMARRSPGQDTTQLELEGDVKVDLARAIPQAINNQPPRTKMVMRFAAPLMDNEKVNLTIVKTKRILVKEQEAGEE